MSVMDYIHKVKETVLGATDGIGTDEDAIQAELKHKSSGDTASIKKMYSAETSSLLAEEAPDAKKYNPSGDVKALMGASEGWGTDEGSIMKTLKGKSPEEMAALKKAYAEKTGGSLDSMLKDELSGDDLKAAQSAMSGKGGGAAEAADKLAAATEGWGTDEDSIMSTLKGKSPKEMEDIKATYAKKYGGSLDDKLSDEMSGDDLKKAKGMAAGEKEEGSWWDTFTAPWKKMLGGGDEKKEAPGKTVEGVGSQFASAAIKGAVGGAMGMNPMAAMMSRMATGAVQGATRSAMGTDEDKIKSQMSGLPPDKLAELKKSYSK